MKSRMKQSMRAASSGAVWRVSAQHVGQPPREVEGVGEYSRASNPWYCRIDPFWTGKLYSASRPWSSTDASVDMSNPVAYNSSQIAAGGYTSPVMRITWADDESPKITEAVALTHDEMSLRIVSVLRGVGPCLAPQLSALIGAKEEVFSGNLGAAKPLLDVKVIEKSWAYKNGLPHPRALIYRLRLGITYTMFTRSVFLEPHSELLTAGAPMMVAGDDIVRQGSTRHQVLAIETVLRALETSEAWAGWMPESTCEPAYFLPHNHRLRDAAANVTADNALIREDGLRVFIELTTGSNATLDKEKVQSWSELFDGGEFWSTLLFVCANSRVAATMCGLIRHHASPLAQERMFVATWQDYAPDLGVVSTDMATLRAVGWRGGSWSSVELATHDFGACDDSILSRIGQCWHVPKWLRKRNPIVPRVAIAA